MATNTPLAGISVISPVLTLLAPARLRRPSGLSVPIDFVQLVEPQRFDLGVLEQPVLQDLFGAQFVAAVDQRHLGGEVGQEQRLFDGGVAAADHDDLLSAIEEAVAGGAGGDAEALELLFRWQAQPFGARAGGKDHRIGGVESCRCHRWR